MARRNSTFTTFLNVEEAKNVDQTFSAMERKANASFNRIAQAAARASAISAGGKVTSSSVGSTTAQTNATRALAAAERTHAIALQNTATASRAAEAASARIAGKHLLESNAARAAAASTSQLERALRLTSVAATTVQGPLGPVAGRITAVANAIRDLSGLQFGAVGAAAGIAAFARYAGRIQDIKSQLNPLFESQTKVNQAWSRSIDIANNARVSLEATVGLYSRLTLAGQQFGASQDKIARVVETASKAARLSGGGSVTQGFALTQLAQGLGSNQLGGDELKSIKENALRLAKAIADGFKNADGSIGTTVGNLKTLGAEGKLTFEAVSDAIERSSAKIDAEVKRLPPSISASTTQISNSFAAMVNSTDGAYGVTTALARGLGLLADNINGVTRTLVLLGTAYASFKAADFITSQQQRIQGWKAEQAEMKKAAQAAVTSSATAREASASRVVALRQERAELQARVLADKAAADSTRATALALGKSINNGDYVVNNPREVQAYARAVDSARVAQDNFTASKTRLKAITGELRTETTGLTQANSNYRQAVTAANGAAKGFGTALAGLLSWTNLLGVALTLGITLLIQWAGRSSAAARASDDLANSQMELGKYVDVTTGKIKEQNAALVNAYRLKRLEETRQSKDDYETARDSLILGGTNNGDIFQPKVDPRITKVINDYRNRKFDVNGVSSRLQSMLDSLGPEKPWYAADPNRSFRKQLQAQIGRAGDVGTLWESYYTKTAGDEVLNNAISGKGTSAARLALATGNEAPDASGGASGTPKTKAQIEAETDALNAKTQLEKAKSDLKTLRSNADNIIATQGEKAYTDQLAAAKQAVDAAAQAEKDRRAGLVASRKTARNAVQDEKDLAATRRDNALIELQKAAPTMSQDEFLKARIKILKTYDDEVNGIDASAAASSSATKQMLADIKKVQAESAKAGESRTNILSGYDDTPKAVDKALQQARQLQGYVGKAVDGTAFIGKTEEEIAKLAEENPLGTGIYTQEMANADKARIYEGLRKPLKDMMDEQKDAQAITRLRIEGYEQEADVLERMLDLQKQGVAVTVDDLKNALEQEKVSERLNQQLEERRSLQENILGLVDSTKTATQDLITSFGSDPKKALKNFGEQIQSNILSAGAKQVTDRLFANADQKLKDLITGSNGVDRASDILAKKVQDVASQFQPLAAANDTLRTSAERAADALDKLATAASSGSVSGGGIAGLATTATSSGRKSSIEVQPGDIVVTGQAGGVNIKAANDNPITAKTNEGLAGLDKLFKSGSFFTGIGQGISKALGGAATGSVTSGVMKMTGIKTSSTGAQIGGSIGALTGLPGGDIIGSIAGGLLGGLFKHNTSASAHVTNTGVTVAGADKGNYSTASGMGRSVQDQINQIVESLGGTLGNYALSIGTRGDEYRVNTTGSTSLKIKNGAVGFDTEEEAIAYAVQDLLQKGVVGGISAASKKILASGQDLQTALEKAMVIESIPKRLKQLTDPVGYAIDELNTEFEKMISYLKEGGATAEQFAQAQELYDKERAEAIKQASDDTVSALQDYLDEMTGGSSSPLNKRATYSNAAAALDEYRSDIAAGKTVDQSDFLAAVQDFQNASRELYGSGADFFKDFDDIYSLVSHAKENASGTTSDLAASPFDTTEVQAAIASQTAATTEQTSVVASKLDDLIAAVQDSGYTISASTLRNLPGFANAA